MTRYNVFEVYNGYGKYHGGEMIVSSSLRAGSNPSEGLVYVGYLEFDEEGYFRSLGIDYGHNYLNELLVKTKDGTYGIVEDLISINSDYHCLLDLGGWYLDLGIVNR